MNVFFFNSDIQSVYLVKSPSRSKESCVICVIVINEWLKRIGNIIVSRSLVLVINFYFYFCFLVYVE